MRRTKYLREDIQRLAYLLCGDFMFSHQISERTLNTKVPSDFDPMKVESHARLIVLYPQHYEYIPRDDIYVDSDDKHAWVEAEIVEQLRAYHFAKAFSGVLMRVDGIAPQRTTPPAAEVNSLEGNGQ